MKDEVRSIIKEARIKRNLSQSELASMIGKKQSHISYLENGKRRINVEVVEEIAQVLEIDLLKELNAKSKEGCIVELPVKSGKLISNENPVMEKSICIDSRIKRRERKTERTQLLMRQSTKREIQSYAEENDTSLNDIIQKLIDSFLEARERGDILCECYGIVFNPFKNVGVKQDERKTSNTQLLLKPSTKSRIKQIADENDTSINDLVHKLADAFIWEMYQKI